MVHHLPSMCESLSSTGTIKTKPDNNNKNVINGEGIEILDPDVEEGPSDISEKARGKDMGKMLSEGRIGSTEVQRHRYPEVT